MIKTDYHLHSTFSHDGKSTMEEEIKQAIKMGLNQICFTEHYDIYKGVENNTLKTIDVKSYVKEFEKYKNQYSENIDIKLGIEIGLRPECEKQIKDMVIKYPFDFIIGSSHITCGKDISKDDSFFEGLTQKEAYLKYFKEVLENIKIYDEFNVYGHLDYIVRYGGYSNKNIEYKDYSEILDKILFELIKKGKGIEINSSGYRYGLEKAHPNIEILKRYKELGGKIITIGSDAHKIEDMCLDFDKVVKTLKELDYKEYTVFENRRPIFISI